MSDKTLARLGIFLLWAISVAPYAFVKMPALLSVSIIAGASLIAMWLIVLVSKPVAHEPDAQ